MSQDMSEAIESVSSNVPEEFVRTSLGPVQYTEGELVQSRSVITPILEEGHQAQAVLVTGRYLSPTATPSFSRIRRSQTWNIADYIQTITVLFEAIRQMSLANEETKATISSLKEKLKERDQAHHREMHEREAAFQRILKERDQAHEKESQDRDKFHKEELDKREAAFERVLKKRDENHQRVLEERDKQHLKALDGLRHQLNRIESRLSGFELEVQSQHEPEVLQGDANRNHLDQHQPVEQPLDQNVNKTSDSMFQALQDWNTIRDQSPEEYNPVDIDTSGPSYINLFNLNPIDS